MIEKKEECEEKENIKELVELPYGKGCGLEELTRKKSTQELKENQDGVEMRNSVVEW